MIEVRTSYWYDFETDRLAADCHGRLWRWSDDEGRERIFAGRLRGMLADDFPAELLDHVEAIREAEDAAERQGRQDRAEDEFNWRMAKGY